MSQVRIGHRLSPRRRGSLEPAVNAMAMRNACDIALLDSAAHLPTEVGTIPRFFDRALRRSQ
jgi:hypothetical protein